MTLEVLVPGHTLPFVAVQHPVWGCLMYVCSSCMAEALSLLWAPALGQEALFTAQPPLSMQTSSVFCLGSAPQSALSTCTVLVRTSVHVRCPPSSSSIRMALTSQARPLPAGSQLPSTALIARTGSPLMKVPSTTSSGSEPPSQSSSSPRHDTSLGLCELMPEQPRVGEASNTAWQAALGHGCLLPPLSSNTRCQPAPTPQSLLHPPGDLTPHVTALLWKGSLHPASVLTLCMPLVSGATMLTLLRLRHPILSRCSTHALLAQGPIVVGRINAPQICVHPTLCNLLTC